MKIEVRFVAVEPSDQLLEAITRQVYFHLSRFAPELESVSLKVSDVNGPRGGVDQRCQVLVRGPGVRSNVVAMSADPESAADIALERCAVALGHSINRNRNRLQLRAGLLQRAS